MPNKPGSDRNAKATQVVGYDQYVDDQIRRTSQAVKAADIGQAVLRLIVLLLMALIAVAMAEHWLVPGGLTTTMRYLVFAGFAAAVGIWGWRELWPLFSQAINPVYAAQTIEQASPKLKNSLVNLLLFRTHKEQMPAAVYDALQRQAAERLVGAAGEETVDNRAMIRWGYLLLGLLVVGAAYALLSPKNPFMSAARVLMPWAEIAAPTRVQIRDVQPGTTEAVRGTQVPVSASITGLDVDDQPELVVLPAGRQASEQRVKLTTLGDDGVFQVDWLPGGDGADSAGEDGPMRWRLEAGDARSPIYRLTLRTAPAMVVQQVHYDYPTYTGYVDRTAEGAGDLRAIEGTKVTVTARANTFIDAAHVDFQGDGRPDVRMKPNGKQAEVAWTLALRDDRRTPRHTSYVLRYTSAEGRANQDPASYRIEVLADLRPEVALLAPAEPTRDVRLNETIAIRFEARDPDFGLAQVRIVGESRGDRVVDQLVLDEAYQGRYEGQWRFTPTSHGLRVGDIVEYWVMATDVRHPEPNRTDSLRQRFRIVDARPGEADPGQGMAQRGQGDGATQNEPGKPGEGNLQQAEGDQGQEGAADATQGDGGSNGQNEGSDPSDAGNGSGGGSGRQDSTEQAEGQNGEGQQSGSEGGLTGNESAKSGEQQSESAAGGQSADASDGAGDEQSSGAGNQANNSNGSDQTAPNQSDSNQQGQPGKGQSGKGEPSKGPSRGKDGQSSPSEDAPVSTDGADDATAFDRIRKHLEQQRDSAQERADQQSDGTSANAQQDASKGSSATADQESNGRSTDRGSGDPASQQEGQSTKSNPADPSKTSKPAAGQQPDQNGTSDRQRDQTNSESARKPSDSTSSERGNQVGPEDAAEANEQPREGTGSQGKNQAADQGAGTSGDRGAGESTPEAGDKQSAGDQPGEPGREDGQMGKGSKRRPGQGDQPGGESSAEPSPPQQNGNSQRGGDEPGGQQPSDGQQGNDESADRPAQPSEGQRGKQAGERGSGSASSDELGGQSKGTEGEPLKNSESSDNRSTQESTPRDTDGNSSEAADQPGKQPSGEPSATAGPGNQPPSGDPQQSGRGSGGVQEDQQGGEPGGDEANLEFASQKTDLLLDTLADQLKKKQVDPDLLDRLGWTEADLRHFVTRWQSRKQAAQQRGGQAQQELDEALRSLGWRQRDLGKAASVTKDEQRDNRTGFRGKVPAQFRDRLQRYNAGVSGSGQ